MARVTLKLLTKWCSLALLLFATNASAFSDDLTNILKQSGPHPFHGIVVLAEGDRLAFVHSEVEDFTPLTTTKIGSISKQITAVLALQLVESGRLDLDKPIKEYLPNLKDSWAEFVTTHHLLSHTSGIAELGQPLLFPPDRDFRYNNLNYDLAADVIEAITGNKFNNIVDGLFESTQMSKSFAPSKNIVRDIIPGKIQTKAGNLLPISAKQKPPREPSGGLASSALDLVKWNQLLHKQKMLLDSYTYTLFTNKYANRHYRYGSVGYGYGIQINDTKFGPEFGHHGLIDGYTSTLMYYPERDMSLIVLENTSWNISPDGSANAAFFYHDKVREYVINKML